MLFNELFFGVELSFADLHPLALEDIFQGNNHTRSKADYYARHLFLRVLCHQLSEHNDKDENMFIPDIPRSSSPEPMGKAPLDEEKTLHETPSPDLQPRTSLKKLRRHLLPFHRGEEVRERNTFIDFMLKKSYVSLIMNVPTSFD
jgi:hypothetical protein